MVVSSRRKELTNENPCSVSCHVVRASRAGRRRSFVGGAIRRGRLNHSHPPARTRVAAARYPVAEQSQQSEPVIFPPDPGWPEYAQREITVDPEPPILGQPTEICAWVLNTTGVSQTVTLDFGIADFGIGLDFGPIGTRTIQVPPFSQGPEPASSGFRDNPATGASRRFSTRRDSLIK